MTLIAMTILAITAALLFAATLIASQPAATRQQIRIERDTHSTGARD
ncbi:hypothetical protein [Pararhodobacter oceanensis]|nr:hypothetical protein [Pararhodobacter oceanensis]